MIGLVISAGIAIWLLRLDAIAETEDDNHRLGVVLAEQTARALQAVDLVLQEMSEKIVASGVNDLTSLHARFSNHDVHDAFTKRIADLPQAQSFNIIDATGRLVNTSWRWPTPDLSFGDRTYFRHLANTPEAGSYISEPLLARPTNVRIVNIARRINAADGTFLGIVVVPIRLAYFDELFADVGFSAGTAVAIVRSDGIVLVHYPAINMSLDEHIPAGSAWYRVFAAGGGNYISPGVFTKLGTTYVSVQRLKAYPLSVDVTHAQSIALARWRRQAMALAAGVALATLSLTLLLRALTRQITIIAASQEQISRQVDITKASEARLATTLEHMNQGLVMINVDGRVVICNRRAIELLDLPPEMMAAHPLHAEVIAYQHRCGEFNESAEGLMQSNALLSDTLAYERRRPNGMLIEVRTMPLPSGGMVQTYTDITARAAAEAMLGLAASHDQLTGLANRNGFHTRLDAALSATRRGNAGLAVLCLDLDRFKAVNDTFGHEVGDQLLIHAAQRMRDIARGTDIIGRLGGDEFAIVLTASNLAGAEQVSRRLLDAIRLPYVLGTETARIGVSIGIAIYPADGSTVEQLLRNADTALYKAKAAGRNTWRAYASGDGQREQQRMQLEQDFRTAVELEQFSLAYQPICNAITSEPMMFEALLRWTHPTRGPVSPADFITIAEQTGLIIPLGRWVIEVACAEAVAWALPLRVAVNLSPAQFRDRSLLAFIKDVLIRTGLPPARLDLEVTEGLLLEDVEDVVKTMQALRAMGIHMVLDDFGTAHSNLSYLRGFPFDTVKIDRSFLRALSSDPQARALVEAMLAMARALGLEVIGEGVETPEQLSLLCLLQCRWVQGFLLGRPATSEQTRDLIRQLAASQLTNDKARLSLSAVAT